MTRIGLCLSYKGINYGTLLQAFATQYTIDKLGYETVIFDHDPAGDTRERKTPARYLLKARYRLFEKSCRPYAPDAAHREEKEKRKSTAEGFRKDHLHSIIRCESFEELREYSSHCAAVVAGSDQIWNPKNANTNFYTLRFAAPGVKRISYASSMGVSEYPRFLKGEAKDFLSRIDCMSVREENAARIIKEIAGVTPKVVCDPTGLLTRQEWEECIPADIPEGPYILCYFLGDCALGRSAALRLSKEKKMPVWHVMTPDADTDESFCDKVISGASPSDFVDLIRGASFVLTDSFHGVMLSMIHEKPFYVFYRHRTNTPYQRNVRIDDLLEHMGLNERLVTGADLPEETMRYEDVTRTLDRFREESLDFLRGALAHAEDK